MRIGINCISPANLPMIKVLIEQEVIHFCEIIVDNFFHFPPDLLLNELANIPIGMHIVSSRFLEKSPAQLIQMAKHLTPWMTALAPIYVSDHLVKFSDDEGRRYPFPRECDYAVRQEFLIDRVNEWQSLLGTTLLLENHASLSKQGELQAQFFATLLQKSACGVLFDFSNAYIAQYNHVLNMENWTVLLNQAKHYHVAGFTIDQASHLAIDSHDAEIAPAVWANMHHYLHSQTDLNEKTLVIEFESTISEEMVKKEVLKLRKCLQAKEKDLAILAMQSWHHHLFYYAPLTFDLLKEHSKEMLPQFVQWSKNQRLAMDWRLHLHFLDWLKEQQVVLNENVVKELIFAAAKRWSLMGLEHIDENEKIFGSPHFPHKMIKVQKNGEAIKGPSISLFEQTKRVR